MGIEVFWATRVIYGGMTPDFGSFWRRYRCEKCGNEEPWLSMNGRRKYRRTTASLNQPESDVDALRARYVGMRPVSESNQAIEIVARLNLFSAVTTPFNIDAQKRTNMLTSNY